MQSDAAVATPSSLYAECVRYAERSDDGGQMLMMALLFSEQWSRPPVEEIARHDAAQAWDYAMHHKTLAEQAIAHAYGLLGEPSKRAFHAHKAVVGYPRLYWHSEAFLEHAGTKRS
jgi:hypothetical protein